MLQLPTSKTLRRSMIEDCVDQLRGGAVVLVDTRRLQHLVTDAYNQMMQLDGLTTWKTPEVLTIHTWLGQLWRQYQLRSNHWVATLLSVEQSRQIWEHVIAENIRHQYQKGYEYLLWHITATANQAKSAYGLLCSYGIGPTEHLDEVSADVASFQVWLAAYERELTTRRCIDRECLADHVGSTVAEIFSIEHPQKIVFAGVDTWTPQLNRLVEALSTVIGSVNLLDHRTDQDASVNQRCQFRTRDEEIDVCARWTRAVIEANPENHRVGIVAPSLREIGPRLRRKLSDYLNPGAIMENRQLNNLAFHMTLGGPLSQVPIVVDAMNLLELMRPNVGIEVMGAVVTSNRIKGWNEEAGARAKLALEFYGVGTDRLSIDHVVQLAASSAKRCPRLMDMFQRAKQLRAEQPETADYAYWGHLFMEWLKIFQSTKMSERQFGVDEWQAYQSWVGIVQSLAELGFVSPACRIETALAKLIRQVGEASVQPRAARTTVQVGEYLSMAGQTFTHLWMLGMNEKSLPGLPTPNPFLPISIQKEYGIPSSATDLLTEQVLQRYERIVAGAEHIVQSCANLDGGVESQRSFLLTEPTPIELKDCQVLSEYADYSSVINAEFTQCESFSDWCAPPVDTSNRISGGTRLLKNQSNCPFRAFAVHRLHLEQLPALELGVSRMARGLMMHRMMELLYRQYTTPEALVDAYESGQLTEYVNDIAQQVVNDSNRQLLRPYGREIVDVEIHILVNLTWQLVDFDLARSAESIRALKKIRERKYSLLRETSYRIWDVEHLTEMSLAGMTLRLRLDRVETWYDEFRLIDYKTGNCRVVDAKDVRPRDPQLAAYAVAMHRQGHKVVDVGYMQIKDGELEVTTLNSWFDSLSKTRQRREADFQIGFLLNDQLTSSWMSVLEQLAAEFVAGEARADPLKGACDHCHVAPVCRIKSSSAFHTPPPADSHE